MRIKNLPVHKKQVYSVNYLYDKEKKSLIEGNGEIIVLHKTTQNQTADEWIKTTQENCDLRIYQGRTKGMGNNWNNNTMQLIVSINPLDSDKIDDKWDEIMNRVMKEFHIDPYKNNTAVWLHKDKDHHHLHILFSKIDMNGDRWDNNNIGRRANSFAKQLVKEYDLTYEEKSKGNRTRTKEPMKEELNKLLYEKQKSAKSYIDFLKLIKKEGVEIDLDSENKLIYFIKDENGKEFNFHESRLQPRFSFEELNRLSEEKIYNHNEKQQTKFIKSSISKALNKGAKDYEELENILLNDYRIKLIKNQASTGRISGVSFILENQQKPIKLKGSQVGFGNSKLNYFFKQNNQTANKKNAPLGNQPSKERQIEFIKESLQDILLDDSTKDIEVVWEKLKGRQIEIQKKIDSIGETYDIIFKIKSIDNPEELNLMNLDIPLNEIKDKINANISVQKVISQEGIMSHSAEKQKEFIQNIIEHNSRSFNPSNLDDFIKSLAKYNIEVEPIKNNKGELLDITFVSKGIKEGEELKISNPTKFNLHTLGLDFNKIRNTAVKYKKQSGRKFTKEQQQSFIEKMVKGSIHSWSNQSVKQVIDRLSNYNIETKVEYSNTGQIENMYFTSLGIKEKSKNAIENPHTFSLNDINLTADEIVKQLLKNESKSIEYISNAFERVSNYTSCNDVEFLIDHLREKYKIQTGLRKDKEGNITDLYFLSRNGKQTISLDRLGTNFEELQKQFQINKLAEIYNRYGQSFTYNDKVYAPSDYNQKKYIRTMFSRVINQPNITDIKQLEKILESKFDIKLNYEMKDGFPENITLESLGATVDNKLEYVEKPLRIPIEELNLSSYNVHQQLEINKTKSTRKYKGIPYFKKSFINPIIGGRKTKKDFRKGM